MANQNLQRDFLFGGKFTVRAFDQNGEIWFVAADVCTALTVNAEQTRRLDDDEKGLRTIQTLGGKQEMLIISESGLYSLILTSRKTEAKRFKRWVTHEVLPAIRKTGKYEARSIKPAFQRTSKLPLKQRIRNRDDLSFTQRDANGRLINWVIPSEKNNWHESYGIGETWFAEIIGLARYNPDEAYYAMRFAASEMIRYWGYGYPEGFFAHMARWTMTGILGKEDAAKPKFSLSYLS